jgi:amidohydrolase
MLPMSAASLFGRQWRDRNLRRSERWVPVRSESDDEHGNRRGFDARRVAERETVSPLTSVPEPVDRLDDGARRQLDDVLERARELQDRTVALRRRIHRFPELGLELPATKQAILDELADLELDIRQATRTSALVAVLKGSRPGPTVLLRGDMDALPLQEQTGLDFSSERNGIMHACGHDTHVAMLASAARLLAGFRDQLTGRVAFFFQPGEEGFHGAREALREGLLGGAGIDADGNRIAGAFALHISATYRSGQVLLRPGPMLASADRFVARIMGRGGHASEPHAALDPIPVAAEVVLALQSMVTRRINIFDPAVVTVGRMTAGTTDNIIPAVAELEGTMRTLSDATRAEVRRRIRQVLEGVTAAHDTTATFELFEGYPVTVNDEATAAQVKTLATEMFGAVEVVELATPIMGAEDWSYVLQEHPGAMAFLGACPPDVDVQNAVPDHSNMVVFDENAFPAGVALHAAMALRWLS